jgi:hypothetical protein
MSVVTLSALLDARNESLAVQRVRPAWISQALLWVRSLRWGWALVSLLAVAGFASKHGLVLAGCAAFVVAAAIVTPVAGWALAGVSLLFLELRRR